MTTRDQVTAVLHAFKAKNGHPAMRALLEEHADCFAISEVPEDKFAAVLAACGGEAPKATPKTMTDIDTVKVYQNWNAAKSRKRAEGGGDVS